MCTQQQGGGRFASLDLEGVWILGPEFRRIAVMTLIWTCALSGLCALIRGGVYSCGLVAPGCENGKYLDLDINLNSKI